MNKKIFLALLLTTAVTQQINCASTRTPENDSPEERTSRLKSGNVVAVFYSDGNQSDFMNEEVEMPVIKEEGDKFTRVQINFEKEKEIVDAFNKNHPSNKILAPGTYVFLKGGKILEVITDQSKIASKDHFAKKIRKLF